MDLITWSPPSWVECAVVSVGRASTPRAQPGSGHLGLPGAWGKLRPLPTAFSGLGAVVSQPQGLLCPAGLARLAWGCHSPVGRLRTGRPGSWDALCPSILPQNPAGLQGRLDGGRLSGKGC